MGLKSRATALPITFVAVPGFKPAFELIEIVSGHKLDVL